MPARPRVLVVEDDPDTRHLYRDVLSLNGFDVKVARGGLEALRMIDASPPDLVLLDLGMPGIDGLSVRRELAANPHTQRLPVVIVTGMDGNFDWLSPDCVLRKPVSFAQLLQAVRRCLALNR
jgi:two-component system, sensor histidine kinase and response regulator